MAYQGFQNLTPFAAEPFFLADAEGARVLTLVVKATFDIVMNKARGAGASAVEIAPEQPAIHKAPVHRGEPGRSSLEYESEAAFTKAAADVVLLGHAQPERGHATDLTVGLRVGGLRKQVRVFGDRAWRRTRGAHTIGPPHPFERMPLVYERAFGGCDPARQACYAQNPVGVGFRAPSDAPDDAGPPDGARLPNLEDPAHLLRDPGDQPPPAGFGFVAPEWAPRRRLAGTFDDAWRATRFPRLPVDFDHRHLNAAPADQQLRGFLRGGEPVEIVNASHRGPAPLRAAGARDRGHGPAARGGAARCGDAPGHADPRHGRAHRAPGLPRGGGRPPPASRSGVGDREDRAGRQPSNLVIRSRP